MPFLRLIRYPNLLIIILTMAMMRYGIIEPILIAYGLKLVFPLYGFILLVLAVVLVAAAGYLINDYFDVQTDTINRPANVIVGNFISPETSYRVYFVLNATALALSVYLSLSIHVLSLSYIFVVTMGLLWFYSTTYKRQLLIGNIVVSLITALVPFMVALYEIPPVYRANRHYLILNHLNLHIIFIWIGIFSAFAFLTNLVREIVKDAEDFEGDKLYGRTTLPIAFGINTTKTVIVTLIALILAGLWWLFNTYLKLTYYYDKTNHQNLGTRFDTVSFLYFLILISMPLLISSIAVIRAKKGNHYAYASLSLKIAMVAGILFALVVRLKFV